MSSQKVPEHIIKIRKHEDMNKEQVYKLLEVLSANDCLHSEWDWSELGEDMEDTGELSENSEWVVDVINNIIERDGEL